MAWDYLRIRRRMTSSGLEWDYYEFQPAAPGTVSVLLPANPINAQWSANAISDWSMSNHVTPTPEIVQDPVATVKSMKEDKTKRKQRRKARKDPRRSEREEVSTLLCVPTWCRACLQHVCLRPWGLPPKVGVSRPHARLGLLPRAWLWNTQCFSLHRRWKYKYFRQRFRP